MRVLKFGGKSLETKEKFQKICEYVKNIYRTDKQIIVVVSAIGNTTDKLTNLSKEFGNNELSNRELAVLLSTGEIQSASLFAMHLKTIGVQAKSFTGLEIGISTFGDYNNSIISYISKKNLLCALNKSVVAVVAGFQGINSAGEITTLGRGGSDTTAVALASVFNVEAEIYSDFDGIFAGDPQKNNYKKLDFVSYDTMINMAKGGAKVLDEKATILAKNHDTTIIAKSSSAPDKIGTIISNIENENITINTINNLTKVTITFNNSGKIHNIVKNVLNCINNIKFYNLEINYNYLSFCIEQVISESVVHKLSTMFDLLIN